ncbi:MAG: CusA/CzcA family heavy metal efflux RND transporter [Vicingaceae bacterium]
MLNSIIKFSIRNKFLVLLGTLFLAAYGLYSLSQLKIGAVPDITNNQVQVITTSQNLSTQDVEQFITYPIELEMANLPGVKEIRSVSKFGISVVTIVFEDEMGTYLPRQLIAEKISAASEQIPEGFGKPEMGPITTGLGEIYQYILDTKPGYEDQYDARELRSIQDWIVKRQLSGIEGVVEINTWGGYLKQYEVALDPARLHAMDIAVSEVFTALQNNNSIAGGSYIEKGPKTYFIRGEGLVTSLADIEKIVVANKEGLPIYMKDVAKVQFGHANRFGAITGNGEGEKVMGQVMMLKGANSKKVIEAVKERVAEISSTLPEGVYINPFLERSELIAKTTFTIEENLILGCLIVIFVVVLLLGNWRSGLLVASIIPLCLLFAFSLMQLFEVDANLMSLGAIDFGIMIDGAVIVVEFVAFQMAQKSSQLSQLSGHSLQKKKDEISQTASMKMMNSAIFGQLIILLVFIPILSLQGVEGKMFRPMALTFCFALIGAMLLCFTYLPVMASLVLKPKVKQKANFSDKLMQKLQNAYLPAISWALKNQLKVFGIAALLLGSALFTFSRMGAEFVPTLDEGDFVIQPVLRTGTSLSETIKICTDMENILLENFPDIKQVVSRIGAAEVPTDPMSMEQSDVIITLKDKSEWTSAESKDGLAALFKEKVEELGVGVEFTQPIEMRFNELITGVRSDIAIKVFGEEIDLLNQQAQQIKKLIQGVDGAADITVEKTVGLPQMKVDYDRAKIARYGLNIADLNQLVNLAFAGAEAGVVFEGEKRYDLVVRLQEGQRKDLDNLRNLYVDLPTGGKIPLRELADISYGKGAAMISRDDTRRRVVVGVMVRNRDLQSVVDDIKAILDEELNLPVGYNLQYGGQFENLRSAKERLWIAVPIALLLIFIMLYFAFHSWKEATLIFSAIPLAAVGGVFLLALRGMPFSISAGVGFIALFGIAVLNGIVLIEHFKELKEKGELEGYQLIIQGTKDRLRAVLLTASAAALGFLPMALSGSAGAEVQRPLATVVIGGLISATLLTLLVLPLLYARFELGLKKDMKMKIPLNGISLLIGLLLFGSFGLHAQEAEVLSYEELKTACLQNNGLLNAEALNVSREEALQKTAFQLNKTGVYYSYDENNIAPNNRALSVWGVQQDFSFPTVYGARKQVSLARQSVAKSSLAIKKVEVEKALSIAYQKFLWGKEKALLYDQLDSLYRAFSKAAKLKYEKGGSGYLESLSARAKQQAYALERKQADEEVKKAVIEVQALVQSPKPILPLYKQMERLDPPLDSSKNQAVIDFYQRKLDLMEEERKLQNRAWMPDLSVNYFQGTNSGLDRNYIGYEFGLKLPLFYNSQAAKVRAAKINQQKVAEEAKNYQSQLDRHYLQLKANLKKHREGLQYFEVEGKDLSDEMIRVATKSYEAGEIDFFRYLQSLENATQIKLDYYQNLFAYNQTIIQLNHLTLD